MQTFNGKNAPPISSTTELFEWYFNDLRKRFPGLWDDLKPILKYMITKGKAELGDYDVYEIRQEWEYVKTEEERRLKFSPEEVACIAGIMVKRATEEGGGYRIPHQLMREILFYNYLLEEDSDLKESSIKKWLNYPQTAELEGALALIASNLWDKDRISELSLFLKKIDNPPWPNALKRMLARKIEVKEDPEKFSERLDSLFNSLKDDEYASKLLKNILLFDIPEILEGLPVTSELKRLFEITHIWLNFWHIQHPEDFEWARDLSVSYNKLGDIYQLIGDAKKALSFFEKSKNIREELYRKEPHRTDLARDLAVSFTRMGSIRYLSGEIEKARESFIEALKILEKLREAEPERADFATDIAWVYLSFAEISEEEESIPWLRKAYNLLKELKSQGITLPKEVEEVYNELDKMF